MMVSGSWRCACWLTGMAYWDVLVAKPVLFQVKMSAVERAYKSWYTKTVWMTWQRLTDGSPLYVLRLLADEEQLDRQVTGSCDELRLMAGGQEKCKPI